MSYIDSLKGVLYNIFNLHEIKCVRIKSGVEFQNQLGLDMGPIPKMCHTQPVQVYCHFFF